MLLSVADGMAYLQSITKVVKKMFFLHASYFYKGRNYIYIYVQER